MFKIIEGIFQHQQQQQEQQKISQEFKETQTSKQFWNTLSFHHFQGKGKIKITYRCP